MAIKISKEELLGSIEAVDAVDTSVSEVSLNTSLDGIVAFLDKLNLLLQNPIVNSILRAILKNRFGFELLETNQENKNNFNFDYFAILKNIKDVAGDKTINELLSEYGDMKIKDIIEVLENVLGKIQK